MSKLSLKVTASGGGGGGVTDHGALTGLADPQDHPQYSLINGSRPFTGTVSGVSPTAPAHLATKSYVDASAGVPAIPTQRVPYGDASNLLTTSTGISFNESTQIFSVGGLPRTNLIDHTASNAAITITTPEGQTGANRRARLEFVDGVSGKPKFAIFGSYGDPDSSFSWFEYDTITNPLTVASGTTRTTNQLFLGGDGTTTFSDSSLTVTGTQYPTTRGIGVVGDVTATGTVAGTRSSFDAYPGLVESLDWFVEQPGTGTITLIQSASYPFLVNRVAAQTQSNSNLSTLRINGTPIGGLSHLLFNTIANTYNSTSANQVALNQKLDITMSGSTGSEGLAVSVTIVRT